MPWFPFKYRGGEITAKVFASTEEEARGKLDRGEAKFQVEAWYLHPDFWELAEDEEDTEVEAVSTKMPMVRVPPGKVFIIPGEKGMGLRGTQQFRFLKLTEQRVVNIDSGWGLTLFHRSANDQWTEVEVIGELEFVADKKPAAEFPIHEISYE